jgi:hypothetical protein
MQAVVISKDLIVQHNLTDDSMKIVDILGRQQHWKSQISLRFFNAKERSGLRGDNYRSMLQRTPPAG